MKAVRGRFFMGGLLVIWGVTLKDIMVFRAPFSLLSTILLPR